jgi:CRISPR-associated protein Cas2
VIIIYIILIYDIAIDDIKGQRILRKVFKSCKKYLNHIQKSVFEGEVTVVQLRKLGMEIKKIIREDIDSVIIFKSRDKKWLDKEFWGIYEDKTSNLI